MLFADDDDLLPALLASIVDSDSAERTAERDMASALATLAALLEPQRESLGYRQRIIDSQVSLSGRELSKQARWQQQVMEALITRGYAPDEADLLSAIGFAVFRRALHTWIADPAGPDLGARLRTALPRARTVLDAGAG
ncbi:hypothetical protein [Salinibacterium sp.]|uniref:hypothetical protein n=1 Tax=Salinibacterium sp. TaxID=1915057 RepID=UPI00286B6989|nr:hypothetical protein [Salinibacterium sp.]